MALHSYDDSTLVNVTWPIGLLDIGGLDLSRRQQQMPDVDETWPIAIDSATILM